MFWKLSVHALLGWAAPGSGSGLQPCTEGIGTGIELISGDHRSLTPSPLGPLVKSYEGCLSDQAVYPPAFLTTLKIVFARMKLCGYTGAQPFFGSRGR